MPGQGTFSQDLYHGNFVVLKLRKIYSEFSFQNSLTAHFGQTPKAVSIKIYLHVLTIDNLECSTKATKNICT